MDIIQAFYDSLASQYDKLFLDWQATTREQAVILNKLFEEKDFDIVLCMDNALPHMLSKSALEAAIYLRNAI